MSECIGRGPMDMARMLAGDDPQRFAREVETVAAMMADRCLIPCPVHEGKFVLSLKWARENDQMDRFDGHLEAECLQKQLLAGETE